MLVAESIDIAHGEKIYFDLGEGVPDIVEDLNIIFGLVADPTDPEAFAAIDTLVATDLWIIIGST